MNKRVIAAVMAGVLALLGVLVLVMWAQGANDRAFEGAELVSVVRVTEPIAQGASAQELDGSTEVVKLPADAVPEGAVTSLSQVSGLSTNASLSPGEVLLKARMIAPGDRGKGNTDVPKGMQEITVSLDSEHTVGGVLKAGNKVGVLLTFDQQPGTDERFVRSRIDQVLVTRVGGDVDIEEIRAQLVTLAVTSADAERIAFGRDFGKVWLTLQNSDTTAADDDPTTMKDIK